jgi:Kef-type K+ transport system membrane component KefB
MAEAGSDPSLILPILIFLAAAVVAVPLFRFVRLGSVIGYLVAGVALGPSISRWRGFSSASMTASMRSN